MRKIWFLSTIMSLLLVSCGGNTTNPGAVMDEAIEMAKQAVPLEDSPCFGQAPSMMAQMYAAVDSIEKMYQAQIDLLIPQNESEVEAAMKEIEELKNKEESAVVAVKSHYYQEIDKIERSLIGKEIPSTFDKDQYSSAKVIIKSFPDTVDVEFEATLTLSAPYGRIPWALWTYMDASGNEISKGAHQFDYKAKYEIGQVVTLTMRTSLSKMNKMSKIDFIKQ